MNERLIPLSEFPDSFQAETVRIRLEAAGIPVIVTGTDAATALSMGGAGSDRLVRVEVAESLYDQAFALLSADRDRLATAKPWICSRCNEQNEPAFEVCWSCNKQQSEEDKLGRIAEDGWLEEEESEESIVGQVAVEQSASPIVDDGNPYRPVLTDGSVTEPPPPRRKSSTDVSEEEVALVRRGFLSSIVGLLLLPPLFSLYSLYVLLQVPGYMYETPKHRNRLVAAWLINLVCIPIWVMFYTGMIQLP